MRKVDGARLRYVERVVRDLQPKGRVRRMLMRIDGNTARRIRAIGPSTFFLSPQQHSQFWSG